MSATHNKRASCSNPDGRYLQHQRDRDTHDEYGVPLEPPPATTVTLESAKTIISKNNSPDIPFTQSINPYRGCEHGCIYCYARPTHAYFDLSPGQDFETKLFAKPNAVDLLERELAAPKYQCTPIALGTNTDPYQPIERNYQITRQIIELLHQYKHPLTIVTKSSLIERDIDLLADLAKQNLVYVFISVTTLDNTLMQKMEPRTTAPKRRLQTLANLVNHDIPTGVMFAPVIPFLNDHEMEHILEHAALAGVCRAGYVMLRLPHEIKTLFKEWLVLHYPDKADRIMNRLKDIHMGKENDSTFYTRMNGQGIYAELIKKRFHQACEKYGLHKKGQWGLNTTAFIKPVLSGQQQTLF